ncbi:aspartate aminotransferase family protein [Sporolactobacillus sp. Y61]|uniref:Aspartate aminotransferase family protein n=1 Tax=Sporolactobacillus sp. Y61 TaxID=3160863 RepID=A0AAU8IIE0_9BACL
MSNINKNTEKSKKLYQELSQYLVDGVASSFHKPVDQNYPICFQSGKGSHLYDVDGNEYIDYLGGMGPLILGYSPDEITMAVQKQMESGTQFASPTHDLLTLSKKLVEMIPCAEKIIFQNTGTEANMLAFRLARGFTGKSKIVKFEGQYHGWSDEERISTDATVIEELGPRNHPWKRMESFGQLNSAADHIIVAPWNDIDALKSIFNNYGGDIAAVIMEPVMLDSGPVLPKKGYLKEVRKLTEDYQILLIFDEVITGFRLAPGGAQAYFHVTPDLAVFAKAIAGGFPISLVAGKKEIMDCGVHASGTYNGNSISVSAALATLNVLDKKDTYTHFRNLGQLLVDGINFLGKKYDIPLFCTNLEAVCILEFGTNHPIEDFRDCFTKLDNNRYDRFVRESLEQGIRFTPKRGRIYLCTRHSEQDIQATLMVIENIFSTIHHDEMRS